MAAAEYQLCCDFESNYPEVVIRVGKITFGEEQRNIKDRIKETEAKFREQNKDKSKKPNKDIEKAISQLKSDLEEKLKSQATYLNQAACALLNSGGGVIRAEIENEDYSYKQHRIGLDIEDSFRDCIQHKDFSAYFGFKQEESCMSIFVKSWSSENSAYPRVCCLNMGLYERSTSSTVKMKPTNAVHFLKRKKDDAKRGSGWQAGPVPAIVQKCLWQSGVQMEKDIHYAVDQFFERERLDLGEILDFTESTTVEFKAFPRDKDNYEFVRNILPRYASAFANTKGGYLIFGVDNHRRVVGCKRNIDPSRFEEVVGETVGTLPVFHFCASEEKVKFSCKALPVYDISKSGEEKEHGYVFAVRIEPSCCVVFERTPDSWIMEAGEVKRLTYTEWTLLMTEEDPDVSHFAKGFQIELSRSFKPPLNKSVYSNKGLACMKTLQSTLFPVNPDGITCKPEEICEEVFLEYPRVKDVIMKKMEEVSSVGILIFSRSWAVDVGLEKHPQVACDILLVAADSFPTLYTVTMDKGYSVSSTIPVVEYSRNVACTLKQKLVNEGGYAQKVCVIPHVIELGSNGEIKTDLSCPVTYPPGYLVSRDGLEELLQALVIALLRFRSFLSDQVGCEFFNLLTIKQYEILTKNLHKSKKLFIYGLPGSGKTVVALQIIEKIMNTFHCNPGEILYICENIPLCKIVRMRVGNICQTVTRIDFLKGVYSRPVKHIVIDEAQNFQLTDGDWYGEAVKLTEGDPRKPGVLWIFLDYLQTSHTQVSGLPDPSKQEPQEWLTTGVRNATQVYDVMIRVMKMIANGNRQLFEELVNELRQIESLNFLSPIKLCTDGIKFMQQKLCSPQKPDNLYDELGRLVADSQAGKTMKDCNAETELVHKDIISAAYFKSPLMDIASINDLFNAIFEFRDAVLRFPHRTEILYKQLKDLVGATEVLAVAQISIAMIEFTHEILCSPKSCDLFLEQFNRMLNDTVRGFDIKLGTNVRERLQSSLPRFNIPYEQLIRLLDEAQCGHSLQGELDICSLKGKHKIVTEVLVPKCLEYFEKGYSAKNIAILCSTVEERDSYKGLLEDEMSKHMRKLRRNIYFTTADEVEENGLVVDTIHRFSGLERSIVFAVSTHAENSFLIPHLLVCMVSRANLHCHILLEQSKTFFYFSSQNILLDNKLTLKQHLMEIDTDAEDTDGEDTDW